MTNQYIDVRNNQRSLLKPLQLKVCDTFISRLQGFLFSKAPQSEEGLLFCYKQPSRINSGIHMLGIPFPLAIIWLDEKYMVVDRCTAKPWGLAYLPKSPACYVIECSIARLIEFETGDQLLLLGRDWVKNEKN
jgi:uncharacterized membrane protein (UPF0127 family)